jgi:hypothetical protein
MDLGREEKTQSASTASLTKPARLAPGTPADPTLVAPKLITIASVREQSQSPKRNSFIGVEPGVMPLNIRMDPTASQKYGAAPAMVEIRIGRK